MQAEDDKMTMKEKLIETADKLKEHGIDVKETPALFRWTYEERPDTLYQLMISDVAIEDQENKTLQ